MYSIRKVLVVTVDLMVRGWPNRSIQTCSWQTTEPHLAPPPRPSWAMDRALLASCERISETATPYVDAPIFW